MKIKELTFGLVITAGSYETKRMSMTVEVEEEENPYEVYNYMVNFVCENLNIKERVEEFKIKDLKKLENTKTNRWSKLEIN